LVEKETMKNEKEILETPVKDRTEEEHLFLIKRIGGVREYLLSMGVFKDVEIKEDKEANHESQRRNIMEG
jgi:hypothetical protein